jgi:hypothetical protein
MPCDGTPRLGFILGSLLDESAQTEVVCQKSGKNLFFQGKSCYHAGNGQGCGIISNDSRAWVCQFIA